MSKMLLKPNYNTINNNYVISYINSAKTNAKSYYSKNKIRIPIDILIDYNYLKDNMIETYVSDRYYFTYGDNYNYVNNYYVNNYYEEDIVEEECNIPEEVNDDYIKEETSDSEEEFIEV